MFFGGFFALGLFGLVVELLRSTARADLHYALDIRYLYASMIESQRRVDTKEAFAGQDIEIRTEKRVKPPVPPITAGQG